jgi:hypothetical protein
MDLPIYELIILMMLSVIIGLIVGLSGVIARGHNMAIAVSDRTVHVIDSQGNYYTCDTYKGVWITHQKLPR